MASEGSAVTPASDSLDVVRDSGAWRPVEVGRATAVGAPHEVAWRRVRWAAFAGYGVVLVWLVVRHGVPTGRAALAAIIVSGLAITTLGQGWRRFGQVLLDWLPFTVVLILYDGTRAVTDSLGVPVHAGDVLAAERWVFGGVEPSLWLQQHLYNAAHVHWYDALCTVVYTSHFLATPVLAAVLWLRDRTVWLRYISRVVLLSLAGLATYCVFPEAPPWLAARDRLSPAVERISARGWVWLHLGDVNGALTQAQGVGANPVAAMPSLHIAFATLVAIFVAGRLRSRWRNLAYLYPLAMGFTLVYTGEHYVLDLVAGVAYAVAVHWLVNRYGARALRQWRRRRLARLCTRAHRQPKVAVDRSRARSRDNDVPVVPTG